MSPLPVLALIGSLSAHAGVPLVFDGGTSAEAVNTAVMGTGLPADQFEPVSLDELLRSPPLVQGAGALRHCAGTPTRMADLRAEATRAEATYRADDNTGAMDLLDLGIAGLGCLGERVEVDVAARMFLLRGGMLARAERLDDARAELQTALSVAPQSVWDEWFPSEGRAILEQLREQPGRVTLSIAPTGSGAAPSIDGHTASGGSVSLRPGLHLLQVASTAGLRSAWLTVQDDATLVIPGNFRRPVLSRLADPSVQTLLRATVPGAATYATQGGALWLLSVEQGAVQLTTLVPPAPPAEPERRRRRRR